VLFRSSESLGDLAMAISINISIQIPPSMFGIVSKSTCSLANSGMNCSPSTNHNVGTLDFALCTAAENANKSDPYTITKGFFVFCTKQECITINTRRKILLMISFMFEITESSSSFPIDGKEAKDLGLQDAALFPHCTIPYSTFQCLIRIRYNCSNSSLALSLM